MDRARGCLACVARWPGLEPSNIQMFFLSRALSVRKENGDRIERSHDLVFPSKPGSVAGIVGQADGRPLYWMCTLLESLLLAAICRIVAAASPWRSSGYQLDRLGVINAPFTPLSAYLDAHFFLSRCEVQLSEHFCRNDLYFWYQVKVRLTNSFDLSQVISEISSYN